MIETERLEMIPMRAEHFAAFESGGENELAHLLAVEVAEGWLVFPEALTYSRDIISQNPDAADWWGYFTIHKADKKLVGNCGFKGKPDADGVCEIGYAVAPAYEGKGLATEAARGLADFAFSFENVNVVQAHTLAAENASNSLLKKLGMQFVKELHDDDDGDIWQWRVSRNEYEKLKK